MGMNLCFGVENHHLPTVATMTDQVRLQNKFRFRHVSTFNGCGQQHSNTDNVPSLYAVRRKEVCIERLRTKNMRNIAEFI